MASTSGIHRQANSAIPTSNHGGHALGSAPHSTSNNLHGSANPTMKLASHRVSSYGSHPQQKLHLQQQQAREIMADALHVTRMDLVRKTYSILSIQLLITAIIAVPVKMISSASSWSTAQLSADAFLHEKNPPWIQGHVGWLWVSMLVLLVCMCAMAHFGSKLQYYPANYISLFILTVVMAVVVGFISALDTWKSLWLSVVIAISIFALLSSYASLAKTYFSDFKYGPYLFAAICVLLVFGIVSCIMAFLGVEISWLTYACDMIGVLIFSFYIIFDTQWILGDCIDDGAWHNGASVVLDLYLDIIRWLSTFLGFFARKRL